MKNLIVSVAVGLLSGFTVYLLIDYLFERPSKSVKKDDLEDEQDTIQDVEMEIISEEPTISVEK